MKPLTPEEIACYRERIVSDATAHQFVGWVMGRAASSGALAEEVRKLMGGRRTPEGPDPFLVAVEASLTQP